MVDTTTMRLRLGLSPITAQIVELLLVYEVVTTEMLAKLSENPRLAIKRLRANLQPFGVTIQSRRTLGYWLTDEDKDKLGDILRQPAHQPTIEIEDRL